MLPQNDFPDDIIERTAHRPYPMPEGPWIMTQSWHDLLFAHWPVGERELRERVPPGLELDLFEGQAWLSIAPFHMTNVAPRGVPALPWVSASSFSDPTRKAGPSHSAPISPLPDGWRSFMVGI